MVLQLGEIFRGGKNNVIDWRIAIIFTMKGVHMNYNDLILNKNVSLIIDNDSAFSCDNSCGDTGCACEFASDCLDCEYPCDASC